MLLQLFRKTATTKLESFDFYALLEDMSKDGYIGTLNGLRAKIADLFMVPPEKALSSVGSMCGDLFFHQNKLFYIKCLINRGNDDGAESGDVFDDPGKIASVVKINIEAGLVGMMGEADMSDLDSFCEGLATILEVQHDAPDIKWEAVKLERGKRPDVGGKAAQTPAESEIELAGVLRDGKLDPLFEAMKANKSELIIDKWLEGREDADEIEYFIDKLYEADFFDEEIVIYSKATGQPVFRANDRSSLEALKAAGIRDVNGDPLDTENVRRLIKMSKEKEEQLSLSWQARIFLIDLLFKVGLSNKDIQVLPAVDNTDVMLAYYDNDPILFLLSNGDLEADVFAALSDKIEKIGKPQVVVITNGLVDTDAAQAAGASGCAEINNMEEFNAKLLELFGGNRKKCIEIALRDFNQLLSINVASMTMARFEN